jgi:alpha-beta hydrolase superfamily lysophospholipase
LHGLNIKTPVIFVGHSMGSLLAVEYTTTYPNNNVTALALLSPPFLQPKESKILFDRLYRKIYHELLSAGEIKHLDMIADFFEGFASFEPNEIGHESFQRSLKNVVIGSRAFNKMKDIQLPTHIFHGSLDFLVNGSNIEFFSKQKNVKIHTASTGHNISASKRNQLIEVLEKLVK